MMMVKERKEKERQESSGVGGIWGRVQKGKEKASKEKGVPLRET